MEFQRPVCLFFLLFITLLSSSQAKKFNVGGRDGSWTPNPSENYNQWSGRNRFQVNDTIVFKYKKGSDSVLEVKKEDYDKCNKANPLKKFDEGDTEFLLDRPGAFYFISGQDGNCEKGQKLVVVVITPRGKPASPAPITPPISSPPSPPSVSPSPAGKSPASSPTPAATSPSPSPVVSTPPAGGPPAPSATSPSPSPTSNSPAGGPPAPSATSPSLSPTSNSPAGGPPAPSPIGKSPSGGPSPGAPSPSGQSPGSANSPESANASAPPPGNSVPSVTPSGFLVLSVTIAVGAVFLRY